MRSFWILMTMVTRPLCWLFAGAAIAAIVYVVVASSRGSETINPKVLTSLRPIRSADQLDQAVKTPPAGDIEIVWGQLAQDYFADVVPRGSDGSRHVTDAHQATINKRLASLTFPQNVAAITTQAWTVNQDVVNQLGKITSLRRLGFLVSDDRNVPLDLDPLSNLKELQLLDFGVFSNDSVSLTPLAQLPQLETIAIGSYQMITKARMAEIASLPALRTLYLPDVATNERAMDALQELANSQSLKRIYIAIPSTETDALAKIEAINPNVKVGLADYSWGSIQALIAAVWMALILSGLGMHISSQFSLSMAELAPRYQQTHQRVTWLLLLTIVVGMTAFVCSFGASWFPVFSLLGLCLVVGVCESIASMSSFGDRMNVKRLGGVFTVIVLGSLIYLAHSHPVVIEDYLRGRSKLLPSVFLGLACLCIVRASRLLSGICRKRVETGRPLMLSMHDFQRAMVEVQSRKLKSTATADETDAVEPFARQANLATVYGLFALAVVLLSMVSSFTFQGMNLTKYVVMFSAGIAFYSLFVTGVKWWQRMPYLANLIHRPPTRSRQIDGLFRAVRADIIKLVPVLVAVLLTISNAAIFLSDNMIVRLIVSSLIVASVASICYAGIIWSLTIRTIWGVAIFCAATYLVLTVLVACIMGISTVAASPAFGFVIAALALGGLAIVATIKARHYYEKLEWARFE